MSEMSRQNLNLSGSTSEYLVAPELSVSIAESIAVVAAPVAQPDVPARPYLYYFSFTVAKSHPHLRNVVRKQLHDAGFESSSPPAGWEHFGVNADCLLLLTVVPLPDGKTYVQVVATSATEGPAKHWSGEMANRVKNDTSVSFD